MTRTRLITLLLTMALALATAPAVLAQDEESSTFDPANIEEFNEDEALIIYGLLRDRLAAYGVAEEDMVAAIDWLDGEFLTQRGDEGGADSDAETGDDEFGKSEGDEPELGDDEEEESE